MKCEIPPNRPYPHIVFENMRIDERLKHVYDDIQFVYTCICCCRHIHPNPSNPCAKSTEQSLERLSVQCSRRHRFKLPLPDQPERSNAVMSCPCASSTTFPNAQQHNSLYSLLRRTSHRRQHVVKRADPGRRRSRRLYRHVCTTSCSPFCIQLTCDSAEWPRVLEIVLQRLHHVCLVSPCVPVAYFMEQSSSSLTARADCPHRIPSTETAAAISSAALSHRSGSRRLHSTATRERA